MFEVKRRAKKAICVAVEGEFLVLFGVTSWIVLCVTSWIVLCARANDPRTITKYHEMRSRPHQ